MEYMKTQLQLGRTATGEKPPFTGVIGGIRYTVNKTGFLSLYKGLDVTLIFSIPKAGIRFGSNTFFKNFLRDKETGALTSGKQFLAGVGAGTSEAILAVTPMETIKTKLIQSNTNVVTGVRMILAESGLAGLYQGLFATILKQSTNQGFRFMAFNKYKDICSENGKKPLTPIGNLLGGMFAGCFSTICNNPFDVVKTQMQGFQAKQYKGTIDCAVQMFKADGMGAFYRGLVPRLGRVVPGQGIIFMCFEGIQGAVQKAIS
jgi:solute carrier family 25 citrate transporter 1